MAAHYGRVGRPIAGGGWRAGSIVAQVEAERTCHFCGEAIDVGQAWMAADLAGGRAVAHAECVYREEPQAPEHAWWEPQEWGPND